MAITFLCITTGTITASAQITTGVVSGALKDEQAVVPGATVTPVSDTRGTKVADQTAPPGWCRGVRTSTQVQCDPWPVAVVQKVAEAPAAGRTR